jgi:hypothetical protein
VSILLSGWEGSAVVVAESLFANSPVAMLFNAHVGSRAYVNEQTGILMRPATIPWALSELIERGAAYRPRQWAVENISCFRSTCRLNGLLREYCCQHGLAWETDIAPFCWRPNAVYVDPAQGKSMIPEYHRLRERFGLNLACDSCP